MPIYLNNAKVEQVRTGVTPSPAGSPPSRLQRMAR